MNIRPNRDNNQNAADTHSKPVLFRRWTVLLICLAFVSAAVVLNRHESSASAIAVTETAPAAQQKEIRQNQKNVKLASLAHLAVTPSIWPTDGSVTSGFGWRASPWGGGNEMHPGIDIASNIGTPVVATADGTVVQSGWQEGYGNMVQIDHGGGVATIYGHNSQIAVSTGQQVKKGQIICYSGNTGISTGPHVHYEVRVNGVAVDPIRYLVLYEQ